MLILAALGVLLPLLAIAYRQNAKRLLGLFYPVSLGLCAAVLWTELWPAAPLLTGLIAALLLFGPGLAFAVVVIDMRWGVFATQTFYLMAVPILTCPLLMLLCIALRAWSLAR